MRHSALETKPALTLSGVKGKRHSAAALLGVALVIAAVRPGAAQPTLASARAGVSLTRAESAPSADSLPSSRGQRIGVTVAAAYLWSAGALLGLVAVVGGECFGDDCGPRPSGVAVMSGAALGGGATIAFSTAGLGQGAYRRCPFRARLRRSAAGVAAGSVPGALRAAFGHADLGNVYLTGAAQLAGSVVALRPCR